MADGCDFLGGYKVGLISASLKSKDQEGRKYKKEITSGFLFNDTILQPKFIAVTKKALKKKPEETTKVSGTDNGAGENIPENNSKNHRDEDLVPTKKPKKFPLNKSADDDPERLARTIFVGNLPIATSRKELMKFFKKYGPIESTRLRSVAVKDFKTPKKLAVIKKEFNPNRNNVNGYVVFKNKESVNKALDSDGKVIGNLKIRVDRVGNEGKKYDHKRSIFVGNLIFDVKEEDVRNFFSVCGDVEGVRIIRDCATGIGKGFGYVLFKEASSVSLALKMNNSELCGRKIRIQLSQENPKATGVSKKGKTQIKFSGIEAKQKFYHKRKALKLQKNSSLKTNKKNLSNFKKHSKRTEFKHKK